MFRWSHALAVSSIALLALAGCNTTKTTAENPPASSAPSMSPQVTSPQATASQKSALAQAKYGPLYSVVTQTKTAVDAGDFKKAGQEFGKFEENWAKVENSVKAQSSDTYNSIETAMDQVKSGIKQSDKTKATNGLQSLNNSIDKAAKS